MTTNEQFAANRSRRLTSFEDELEPIVEAQLAAFGPGWYAEVVTAASVLWLETFEAEGPDADPSAPLETFQRELGETLEKTSEPADPPSTGQVDRITRWVGVYAVNHATYHASIQAGSHSKVWVDMDDGDVRSTHSAAAGQRVQIKGTFEVGGYKVHFPGEPVGPPEIWINCRCLLRGEGGGEMRVTTTAFAADVDVDDELTEVTDETLGEEDLVDDATETPWHGVLAPEGIESGDKRMFAENSLTWRNLPLPLTFQRMSSEGHMGSVIVGRIDEIWREGNEMRARGIFDHNVPEAHDVISGLMTGIYRGVSVDVDMFEILQEEIEEGEEPDIMEMLFGGGGVTTASSARICGASVVGIPAFMEAFVALGADFDEDLRDPDFEVDAAGEGEGVHLDDNEEALAAAAFAPGTKDGPGWLTHPRATARIRRYWTEGKGAAKIRWGQPGDFNRCRKQLAKYVSPAFLAGTCANMHKEATGVWPGRDRHALERDESLVAAAMTVASHSASQDLLDASWFKDPGLTQPTALTITDDGRVFGHLAIFGTCHIGIPGVCTTPPRSPSGYSQFLLGLVETTEGDVPVGHITMDTGHAALSKSARAAAAHYDDTGTVVADIATGEDGFGIWFSGALRDGVTDQERKVLKAAQLSGDWRDFGRGLDMVAALAVNVPGFPVPRTGLAASGAEEGGAAHQTALVAAGSVPHLDEKSPTAGMLAAGSLAAIGRVVADELEYRSARREKIAAARAASASLTEMAAARRAEKLAAARAALTED